MGIYYYLGAVILGVLGISVFGYLQWDKILKFLKGKKIAVLGERAVGKTTLVQFLSENSIPERYEQTLDPKMVKGGRLNLKNLGLQISQTLDPKMVKGRRLNLKDLGLQINQTFGTGSKYYKFDDLGDIGGDEVNYGLWKREFDQADIILYLFFADRLLMGDQTHIKRVKKDVELLKAWEEERNKKDGTSFMIFGIGTHCDRLEDNRWDNEEEWGTFFTEFTKKVSTTDVRTLTREKILLGSMKTKADAERLVFRLFANFIDYFEKNQ